MNKQKPNILALAFIVTVAAVIAVLYYLFAGGSATGNAPVASSTSSVKSTTLPTPVSDSTSSITSPLPAATATPTPTPTPAKKK